eukprot:SAG11_NODE_620_length_8171_cov_9.337339_6_plen_97_part_00
MAIGAATDASEEEYMVCSSMIAHMARTHNPCMSHRFVTTQTIRERPMRKSRYCSARLSVGDATWPRVLAGHELLHGAEAPLELRFHGRHRSVAPEI